MITKCFALSFSTKTLFWSKCGETKNVMDSWGVLWKTLNRVKPERERERERERRERERRERTNTCTDQSHTSDDHKLFKKMWMFTSRHIIINTDDKEKDRKICSRKGSLGHWSLLLSKLTLPLWNWHGYCHAVSNQLRILSVTPVTLLVKKNKQTKKQQKNNNNKNRRMNRNFPIKRRQNSCFATVVFTKSVSTDWRNKPLTMYKGVMWKFFMLFTFSLDVCCLPHFVPRPCLSRSCSEDFFYSFSFSVPCIYSFAFFFASGVNHKIKIKLEK